MDQDVPVAAKIVLCGLMIRQRRTLRFRRDVLQGWLDLNLPIVLDVCLEVASMQVRILGAL